MEILIITGLSGGGKSRAASYLEDIGYYTVDNLPAEMMVKFADFCAGSSGRYDRVALVYDVRSGEPTDILIETLERLKASGVNCRMLFLEADNQTIVNRYKETRRMHPLQKKGESVEQAIRREREWMQPVRDHADFVLDTSALSIAKLRSELLDLFGQQGDRGGLAVNVLSFGFKHGIPIEADLVFDVRFMPNPYYVPELKNKTGLDQAVRDFVFSFRQNAKMQETFMENRRKIGDVNASLQDTLSGIRVVQSFANEDIERAKFKKSNEAFLVSKRDNYHCMGSFMSSNLFFQGMMYLVTLVYGGYLIAQGEMQTADLAMYALYIGIFISPIQILVELVEMMQKGLSGFRRFLDVMETESEIRDADNAAELTDVKGHVRYDHVSFHYSDDETPVLSDISIDIPAGKSIALVGPSGSGKTTICSLLPRFYDVTGGSITVDGKDIRGLTLKSLRSQIGMVQQDVYLFDGTIKDNIAYGKPGASDEEIIKAAKCASIHDFIMELPDKYDTYVGERGTRLSGGQKQRISIARVFLKNPPILILDEATSALDNESERWIQKSLEELSKNRTTITIAHRLSTIRDADEIIVITEDGIAERGTHAELLEKNGLYATYYNM